MLIIERHGNLHSVGSGLGVLNSPLGRVGTESCKLIICGPYRVGQCHGGWERSLLDEKREKESLLENRIETETRTG